MLLKVEELALEIDEAEKLSKAIEDLAKFYPVAIDPKKLAWANLGITAAQIYGLRIMAYRLRKENEKAARPKVATPVSEMPRREAPPVPPVVSHPMPAATFNPSDVWNESAEIVG